MQIIISGKIHDEMISQWLNAAQRFIDDDTFDTSQNGRADVWRIQEVRIAAGVAFRPKAGHGTAQEFGPVAGTKRLTAAGHALDNALAGRLCNDMTG